MARVLKLPIFELFLSVGNPKPKLKWVFKLKLKPNSIELPPRSLGSCHLKPRYMILKGSRGPLLTSDSDISLSPFTHMGSLGTHVGLSSGGLSGLKGGKIIKIGLPVKLILCY